MARTSVGWLGDERFRADDTDPSGTTRELVQVTSLEAVRYAALVALIAAAAGYTWLTVSALNLVEPIRSGRLADVDVGRLDRARDWTNIFLAVALPLQAWWVVTGRVWARRAGAMLTIRRPASYATATTAIAGIFAIARFGGAPSTLQGVLLIAAGTAAWAAVMDAASLASWTDHGLISVRLWATGLALVTIVHALVGATGAVDPTTSVQAMAFVSVLLGLILANTAIVAGVFTLEVEDDLRSSSALARWREQEHDEEHLDDVSEPTG
jgi:hypothetical protein